MNNKLLEKIASGSEASTRNAALGMDWTGQNRTDIMRQA